MASKVQLTVICQSLKSWEGSTLALALSEGPRTLCRLSSWSGLHGEENRRMTLLWRGHSDLVPIWLSASWLSAPRSFEDVKLVGMNSCAYRGCCARPMADFAIMLVCGCAAGSSTGSPELVDVRQNQPSNDKVSSLNSASPALIARYPESDHEPD